jgi:chromosome partitioning protein
MKPQNAGTAPTPVEQPVPIIVSLFNNKGGVGKTTFLFHVAHRLADIGKTVLMVDCDSQCNLTAYSLPEAAID